MDHNTYTDDYIRNVLKGVRSIALVGASPKSARPSHQVMDFLLSKDYLVYPVNPGIAGKNLLGQKVYARLEDIPGPVDMVDVFRNSQNAGPVCDAAIRIGAKIVWMQLGVRNDDAARRAEAAGLKVVMNRCPKIEIGQFNINL